MIPLPRYGFPETDFIYFPTVPTAYYWTDPKCLQRKIQTICQYECGSVLLNSTLLHVTEFLFKYTTIPLSDIILHLMSKVI